MESEQHLKAVGEQVLDLVGVPVAGISQHRPRPLSNAGVLEFCECRVDHRLQLPEVRGLGRDLGGDHDLLLGHHCLRVVALDVRLPLGAHLA
jgi:hypothetical protein